MPPTCVLCSSEEDDEMTFGSAHPLGNMMVHRNCLYLSSNLVQRGNERNGILRFLKEDIFAEVDRCRPLICYYCRTGGANIGCCRNGCRRTFHTKCGLDNLALNQYRDTYKSYCHSHVRSYRYRPGPTEFCVICQDMLLPAGERFSVVNVLQSPCCRNGWYHRPCLQAYANSAGYFFKCPLCNNSTVFHDVALFGISVPNRDASWEVEPGAYADHGVRDQVCTAPNCITPTVRRSNAASLLYCTLCGSNPVHIFCTSQEESTYNCTDCAIVSPISKPTSETSDESTDSSDDESDPLDSFIGQRQPGQQRPTPREPGNDTNVLNSTHDLIHSKLRAPSSDDDSGEDDDLLFQQLAERERKQVAEKEERQRNRQRACKETEEQPTTSGHRAATAAACSTPPSCSSAVKAELKPSSSGTPAAGSRLRAILTHAAPTPSMLRMSRARSVARPSARLQGPTENRVRSPDSPSRFRSSTAGSSSQLGGGTGRVGRSGEAQAGSSTKAGGSGEASSSRAGGAPSSRAGGATAGRAGGAPAGSAGGAPTGSAGGAPATRARSGSRTAALGTPRGPATAPRQGRRSSSRLRAQANQENAEPGSAAAAALTPIGRSLRQRTERPLLARMQEKQAESPDGERKRRGSPTQATAPPRRRFLRSMSPEEAGPTTNNAGRRRTVGTGNPSSSSQASNFDVSCVANRTRKRLPHHLAASHK
ncbi:hypothetical protein KR009_001048 [Drosophila setifemur]|nr:hypothetical protein KR009_001048 [Drosophila setifemur]